MSETMIPEGLVVAYKATSYRVFADAGHFVLRIGQRSDELIGLFDQTDQSCAAFITAENPYSEALGVQENAANLELLREQLHSISASVFEGEGQGEDRAWPAEQSFLALGVGREQACGLGIQYRQNAIVWIGSDAVPELILLR